MKPKGARGKLQHASRAVGSAEALPGKALVCKPVCEKHKASRVALPIALMASPELERALVPRAAKRCEG